MPWAHFLRFIARQAAKEQGAEMPLGLPLALMLMAQASAAPAGSNYGPAQPTPSKPVHKAAE